MHQNENLFLARKKKIFRTTSTNYFESTQILEESKIRKTCCMGWAMKIVSNLKNCGPKKLIQSRETVNVHSRLKDVKMILFKGKIIKQSLLAIGKKIYIVNFETFETRLMKHKIRRIWICEIKKINTSLCAVFAKFLSARNKILKTQNVLLKKME